MVPQPPVGSKFDRRVLKVVLWRRGQEKGARPSYLEGFARKAEADSSRPRRTAGPTVVKGHCHGYEKSRGQRAPPRLFGRPAEGGPAHRRSQHPVWIGTHQRLGPPGAQRGPASHPWRGPSPRPPYQGTLRAGEIPAIPDGDFSWLTKGEVEVLGI